MKELILAKKHQIYKKFLNKAHFKWLQGRVAKQSVQRQKTPPDYRDLIYLQKDWVSPL